MVVVIFANFLSQPSRAVIWFCKLNDIPHTVKLIDLGRGEQRKPEYAQHHPFQKVPAIEDDGKKIFESHSILRYLAQHYNTPDHWYPKDLLKRTKVDQYLDWHPGNLRKGTAPLVFAKVIAPMRKLNVPEAVISTAEKDVVYALKCFEEYWLKDSPFIGGSEISIADLSAFGEVEQLRLAKYDLSSYPKVSAWKKRMESLPHFSQVHSTLVKLEAKL